MSIGEGFIGRQEQIPELLIKLAEGAAMPSKANDTDTGYDLTATGISYNEEHGFLQYNTGVFMQIPEGYEVKIYPRSSISKYDLLLCNGVAVIDETYHNEILLRFKTTVDYEFGRLDKNDDLCCSREGIPVPFYPNIYRIGDKIAQFEMKKKDEYSVVQVDDIEDSIRGGFGSSDLYGKNDYLLKGIEVKPLTTKSTISYEL